MNLKEYLAGKYKNSYSFAISDDECVALGIGVPPERGWPEKYGAMEIDLPLAKALMSLMLRVLANSSSPRKKATAQWAIETIRLHFGRAADDVNVAPKVSKELRAIRKDKRRKRKEKKRASEVKKFYTKKPANSDTFLESYEWRRVRMVVLKRDGAKCACCGATPADGLRMHVDHIKPRKTHPALALDPKNLQVLCEVCNHGKGNWDTTDWREQQDHLRSVLDADDTPPKWH